MTLLVIGGTGSLGRQIVRKALDNGFQVRCMVRNKRKSFFLHDWGAELVYGDLTIPDTLPLAFQGITAIIDVSTTRLKDDEKSFDIDWFGKLRLIELAKQINVKRFIFFSISNACNYPDIPLMKRKADIEAILKSSAIPYTIFQCAAFYQALINQYAIPLLEGKTIWTTNESVPIFYMNTQDAARICIKSLGLKSAQNKTFLLEGSKGWNSISIIKLCEKLSGQKAKIEIIPLKFLRLLKQITLFFDWTYKISQQLAFIELLQNNKQLTVVKENNIKVLKLTIDDLVSLELYLREYFEMMLLILENLDLELQNKQKDLLI